MAVLRALMRVFPDAIDEKNPTLAPGVKISGGRGCVAH
mgnify:CR=1 FL=1